MDTEEKGEPEGEDPDEIDENEKKCCPRVNRQLLVPKLFYFFFFSGWGSLLPYLALYFKQLLLTPTQVGILMGLKPFVNFLVIPIWGAIVDRFNKSRLVLILSLISLIISTFAISLVPPPVQRKIVTTRFCNATQQFSYRLSDPDSEISEPEIDKMVEMNKDKYRLAVDNAFTEGSPWPINAITNFKGLETVYIDSKNCFITLFLITFFGTLISSPSLALVDTATMQLLGKNTHKYGMQRLTGSIGWGIGASVVGASLKTTHRCDENRKVEVVDFIPCFYTFAGLMSTALILASRFKFNQEEKTEQKRVGLRVGLQALQNSKYLMFLFTALYLGFLMAFIKTFLFWHLKDLGGPQLLFSVISAVNCFAEVSMYFLSSRLIKCIGHAKVLYLGLICYAIRLFYYASVSNPWLVLPVEILPGITTAAVWAACLSYVSRNSMPGAKTTMQCILHGVHWGLGYGAGEIIGGLLVHRFGAPATFVIFGILCILILVVYVLIDTFGEEPQTNCYETIDESPTISGETAGKDEKEKLVMSD